MKIAVMGSRELASGFKLTGVDALNVSPGPEAEKIFSDLSSNKDIAVIVLNRQLHKYLKQAILKLRSSQALPVVLALPDRGEEAEASSTAELLAEFLGMKV